MHEGVRSARGADEGSMVEESCHPLSLLPTDGIHTYRSPAVVQLYSYRTYIHTIQYLP